MAFLHVYKCSWLIVGIVLCFMATFPYLNLKSWLFVELNDISHICVVFIRRLCDSCRIAALMFQDSYRVTLNVTMKGVAGGDHHNTYNSSRVPNVNPVFCENWYCQCYVFSSTSCNPYHQYLNAIYFIMFATCVWRSYLWFSRSCHASEFEGFELSSCLHWYFVSMSRNTTIPFAEINPFFKKMKIMLTL